MIKSLRNMLWNLDLYLWKRLKSYILSTFIIIAYPMCKFLNGQKNKYQ